ncbi:hypothetical protein GCM10012275_04850 [Longimycelium tulufanense]|uniref:PPM-type phosphatase domain-containing protein n=1 Tax=Longimycelium tulufanense TaxID=907463 RepID=A0A8J3C618_9PSEU|nr:hypothetical protein GCM10012275_04850 [Longimycelium tulufanense]
MVYPADEGGLPSLPGARLAVRVVPGDERRGGRDFYDVVALPDGRLAAAVGHLPAQQGSLGAVAVERLRGALAVQLLHGRDAAMAMAGLDRYAEVLPALRGVSLCLVVFDPATRSLECACAGSAGPLVVGPNSVRQLVGCRGSLLGLPSAERPEAARACPISPEEMVVLHTAGAGRRAPGRESPPGRLAALVADPPTDPGELCDRIAERLARRPPGAGGEGAVLLVLSPEPPPADLVLTFPARAGRLPAVRDQVREWLEGLGLGTDDVQDLEQAVGEAAANAVEHAYPPGQAGMIRVSGSLDHDGTVHMVVADGGWWRPPKPDPGLRGRGLLLMQECVDEVQVDPSSIGTTVTLRKAPRRESQPVPPASGAADVRLDLRTRPGEVVVRGDLPERSGPPLRRALLHASRGGAFPVVVDLRDVGEVTDGAVRALLEVGRAADAAGQQLVVVAPPGSSALDALTLVGAHRVVRVVAAPTATASSDGANRVYRRQGEITPPL